MVFIVCGGVIILGMVLAVGIAAERSQTPVDVWLRIRWRRWQARWKHLRQNHPNPVRAWSQSGVWLLMLLPLVNHLSDPQHSLVGQLVWALTIGPHEIGHFVCAPFGWFLMVAGGSIWQVLVFWLPVAYGVWKRQIHGALLFWMMSGHSLINLSVYIRDAQERDLPLIFGLSDDYHDWWNILRTLGLLPADDVIADGAIALGVLIVASAIGCGIWWAWLVGSESQSATPVD